MGNTTEGYCAFNVAKRGTTQAYASGMVTEHMFFYKVNYNGSDR